MISLIFIRWKVKKCWRYPDFLTIVPVVSSNLSQSTATAELGNNLSLWPSLDFLKVYFEKCCCPVQNYFSCVSLKVLSYIKNNCYENINHRHLSFLSSKFKFLYMSNIITCFGNKPLGSFVSFFLCNLLSIYLFVPQNIIMGYQTHSGILLERCSKSIVII